MPEVPAILAAGLWEGACLGTVQAIALRRSGIAAWRWIFATIAVAVIGYAGSLVAGGLLGWVTAPALPAISVGS